MAILEREIRPTKLMKKANLLRSQDMKILDFKKFVSINCPACKSDKFESIFLKNKFKFVKCLKCSTVFINPRPSQNILELYYTKSKSIDFWGNIYKKTQKIRKKKIFKPRVFMIKNILKSYGKMKIDTLMEIGAGYGWFCELARKEKLAKDIFAIEPNPILAQACRKIKNITVIQSTIENYETSKKMDVIVNFEVIEHLFDPRSFLKSCYSLLKKKGIFICSTPNFNGLDIQILGKDSDNVIGPNHINYFNPQSIIRLLKSIGFRNINVETPGMLDTNIIINKMKENKIKNDKFKFFEILSNLNNECLINDFQELLQKYKLSSNMVASSQK